MDKLKLIRASRQVEGYLRKMGATRYRVVNEGGGPARVDIYDDIGGGGWFGGGVSPQDVVDQLAAIDGDVEVHLNSGGGDVFDGIAIYNALAQRPGSVTTVVDGIAASIASVIAQAGKTRQVAPGGMLMIHDALSMCIGNSSDMREVADLLDQVSDNIASIYAARSGSVSTWRDAMRKETWYTADQAVSAGLADRLAERPAKPEDVAAHDFSVFAHVPGWLKDAGARHESLSGSHTHPHPAYGSQGGDAMHSHEHSHDGEASHDHGHDGGDGAQDAVTISIHGGGHFDEAFLASLRNQVRAHAPGPTPGGDAGTTGHLTPDQVIALVRHEIRAAQGVPGSHGDHERWDPDGDGDCDACPEGDTDHDYWSESGEQLQDVPGKPVDDRSGRILGIESMPLLDKALPVHHTATTDTTWDGPAAVAAMPAEAAVLKYCHAWQDSGADADLKGSYKFPHHKTQGGPANLAACRNGLARLSGASIPDGDRGGVEAHLNAHLKDGGGSPGGDDAEDHAGGGPQDGSENDISGIGLEEIRSALRGAKA